MDNLSNHVCEIKLEEKHYKEAYISKDDLPKGIKVEAGTICQLNCPCCYMRLDKEGVKNGCGLGFLSFVNFKKLVDDNYLECIELSNSGEIFLNLDLIKIMEYAYKNKIKLSANTGVNLNTLSDEMAEALVKYQFDSFHVSIDGASQETYSIYRVNGNYDKVIENIKKIIYFKEKYNSIYPTIEWKFVVFGHNEHEIIKAKREAEKLGIRIFFEMNWDSSYSPVINKEFISKETGLDYNYDNTENVILAYQRDPSHWFFCSMLWEQPQINWDGQVLGCCSVHRENFGGNAFKDGLLKALNHPKMIYAKNMLTGNAPIIDSIPCGHCFVFEKMRKMNYWMKSPNA